MIEMKVIMALILRRFDIRAAYDEFDAARLLRKGDLRKALDGARMYVVWIARVKVVDGKSVRVRRKRVWIWVMMEDVSSSHQNPLTREECGEILKKGKSDRRAV